MLRGGMGSRMGVGGADEGKAEDGGGGGVTDADGR